MKKDNIIIGIDTSCYTTSIAAISLDKKVIFNEKIMLTVQKDSKGLRQSEAVFQHTKNLEIIGDKIKGIMSEYKVCAICASSKPRPRLDSYMPVFTVGKSFARLLGSILSVKVYETTHQENHISASLLTNKLKNKSKFLSVHMSGGTTEVLLVNDSDNCDYYTECNIDIVGSSTDLSFGQLIDRIGVKLGYEFPCGKFIDENAIKCSLPIIHGLKTSVKEGYINVSGLENQAYKYIEDKYYVSKLVMDSINRSMYKSLLYICSKYKVDEVVFAGGVSASNYIKEGLSERLNAKKITAYFTDPEYCTDNAIGCAIIGLNKFLGEQI